MISISSRPSLPDSPACGFSPATRDARRSFPARVKKIREQHADSHYLRLLEGARDFAQRNVRRHQRDREFSASQTHREIFDAAALGKKFRLSREPESDFVHPRLVNRPGYDRIQLAASGECDSLFERSGGGPRSFRGRLA